MRGYRGFLREFGRTGSLRSLWLQVRTGVSHGLRRALRRAGGDAVALFYRNYSADGIRPHDPGLAAIQLDAQACLVCGLCSAECARVGGEPALDPRDAVVAAIRLQVDAARLGIQPVASPCSACAACDAVCPVGIAIHRVQEALTAMGREQASA